ncbi:uncharacterized protein GJ701_001956 isoform 1-T9 [Geothlypis trichas]
MCLELSMMLTVATCQPFIALRENWCPTRPPPWPIPFPPPQQVDTEPGKPPAMPHVAAPHCPSGIRPRGQHTGNSTGPEHAALPILRSSPAAPANRGRAPFQAHPPPHSSAFPTRRLLNRTAKSSDSRAHSHSHGRGACSVRAARHPHPPQRCWGRAPRAGTGAPIPQLKNKGEAEASRPLPSSSAQLSPARPGPARAQAMWPCPDFPSSPRARRGPSRP